MARKLRITDNVQMQPVSIEQDPKVLKDYANAGVSAPLLVKIAATHSGLVTGNNTFYLPDKMKKGTDTWISQYPKPVLVHHELNEDAVGRVVRAEYVDIAPDSVTVFKDSTVRDNLQKFKAGLFTKKGELQFIKDVLVKSEVLKDKNYKGMGFIQLVAAITDPDAIQKIKDGRYLTGSVSASTDAAVCSVCESDWILDGKCEHSPGESYDGMQAFLIAGNFEYEEYSWVNRPADQHSSLMELVSDGKSERINKTSSVKDALKITTHADKVMLIQMHDAVHYRYDFDAAMYLNAKDPQGSYATSPGMSDKEPPPKDVIDLHTKLHKEASDVEVSDSLVLGAMDEWLSEDLKPQEVDLNTTDSKKEKTMSVTDTTIATEKKEEAPLTPEVKDEVKTESDPVKTEEVKAKADEVKEPELCAACSELFARAEDAFRTLFATKDTELAKLNDQLKVLREEFKHLYQDISALEDELISAKTDLRESKATRAVDMKRLSGVEIKDVKEEITSLMKLDDKQLDTQVASVDITKIIDKLNSGLANTNPEAIIANPSAPANSSALSDDDARSNKVVQDTYQHLMNTASPKKAENYLARMKREGYFKD